MQSNTHTWFLKNQKKKIKKIFCTVYKALLILLFVFITNNQQNQQNQQGFTHPIVTELNGFSLLIGENKHNKHAIKYTHMVFKKSKKKN